MSWYKEGFETLDELPEGGKQNRFWLKKGDEKQIVFLEAEPFTFYEHQVTLNGDFKNYFTCLKNLGKPCPLCVAGFRTSFVGLFTIVDLSEWDDRDGKKHVNETKVFCAKSGTLKLLRRHAEKGRVKNGLFTVGRTDDQKSPVSGSYFDFEKAVDPLDYDEKAVSFDFSKLCAPLDSKRITSVAKLAEVGKYDDVGKSNETSFTKKPDNDDDDDDIPF